MTDGPPVVLVAEDDPGIREFYETTLDERWRTRITDSEEAALAALDDSVAVALLDRDLGDGTGDAVLATIREREIHCRVAMVTGATPDADVDSDAYLTKPVDPERLLATVAELLLASTYDEYVGEYFALVRRQVVLEDEHGRAELEGTPTYEALRDRLVATRESADDVLDELGERDAYQRLREGRGRPMASV